MAVRSLIIDTDPGIDDAMAILLAFQAPELNVLGLTTVFGNVQTELAAQNGLRLAELAGQPDLPVALGAVAPLVLPLKGIADFVHGQDGLGDIGLAPPAGQPIDRPAAQFIVDTCRARPGQVSLVALGPLTNLALALALEPRLPELVAGVVLMGGAVTVNGNVTPAAEANILADPHAADAVFTAGWPVTMVGLDVTMQTIMSPAYLASLAESGSPLGQFVSRISQFYLAFHHRYYGLTGAYTHDPSAIAYLLDPTLFTTRSGPVRVVTEGLAIGQTILDQRQRWSDPHAWSNQPSTQVCLEVDSAGLLDLYRTYLLA
jgi:inosine-uridine nucleoside N-ribohydrolase